MANSAERMAARDILTAGHSDGLVPAADAKRFLESQGARVRFRNGAALLLVSGYGDVQYLGTQHGYVDVDDILDTLES